MAVARLRARGQAGDPPRICVAVSGGSDSLALLALAVEARDALAARDGAPIALTALTVDHGLRPQSADEAAEVGRLAEQRACAHRILRWRGAKPGANLQAAAREARYALLADWRRAAGVGPLLLGHTRDDLAETFVLRLLRGSGVDGLAAMAEDAPEEPEDWARAEGRPRLRRIRPLLGIGRAQLRRICQDRGLAWIDDPSNDDPRFDRVKVRRLLAEAAPLGLSADRLVKTALTLSRARAALEDATIDLHRRAGRADLRLGLAQIAVGALRAAPREIALRWLARALAWGAGAAYPPRLDSLEAALDAVLTPAIGGAATRRTLHGCLLEAGGGDGAMLRVMREPAAAAGSQSLTPGRAVLWDNRFRAVAHAPGCRVGPVGPAGRRLIGVSGPPAAVEAMAGIWRDAELLATPFGAAAPSRHQVAPRLGLLEPPDADAQASVDR